MFLRACHSLCFRRRCCLLLKAFYIRHFYRLIQARQSECICHFHLSQQICHTSTHGPCFCPSGESYGCISLLLSDMASALARAVTGGGRIMLEAGARSTRAPVSSAKRRMGLKTNPYIEVCVPITTHIVVQPVQLVTPHL